MNEENEELIELKEELSESQKTLIDLDNEITRLKKRLQYNEKNRKNYQSIINEKYELEKKRNSNIKYIEYYKSQIIELEKKFKFQKSEIISLTQENEKLKSTIGVNIPQKNQESAKIKTVSDLRQSLGFHLKCFVDYKEEENKDNNLEKKEEYNTPGLNTELKENEFEKLKKKKIDYEIIFHELQEKINNYLKKIKEQETFLGNYRTYINALNINISSLKQKLRIRVIGKEKLDLNESNVKVGQLIKNLDSISKNIFKSKELVSNIKNKTLKKGENILKYIQTKLIGIDSNKNLTFNYLSNKISFIEKEINDLKVICKTLETNIKDSQDKINEIEQNINIFKIEFEKYIDNYKVDKKKIDDALYTKIRKLIRKNSKKIIEDANKNIKNEKNQEDNLDIYEKVEEEGEDLEILNGSTLIKINDFGKNIDLFRSSILFANNNEFEEKKLNKARLFKKNWNEVCYIYDDYDIHDVNYLLKAVGLGLYSYFSTCSDLFYIGKEIEIIELEVNGEKVNYEYKDYYVDFDIMLNNLDTAKVHLKYKEKPEKDSQSLEEIETRKFYRKDYYGLNENLSGQMGKFRLILKGNFDIVNFKEDIFILNENNKNEKEYIWGGKVPEGGKRTLVTFSKNYANWSFNFITKIMSQKGNLTNTTLKVPTGFIGGNNDIIQINYSSPQTKDIEIDEEQRIYEINYCNTKFSKGEFTIKGEIRNRCKGNWDIDLSDEKIEEYINSEDKKDKNELKQIAKKIIEDFDEKNKDNVHKYMDYAKIGKWVYDNLNYDLNYSGKNNLSALYIYKIKAGVCHHYTRLANALLYSLGYKVLYINGFLCKTGSIFDENSSHSWSLINISGKWFPFDATLGIFSGKLPVCHIFKGFYNNSVDLSGSDEAIFECNNQENGTFIK